MYKVLIADDEVKVVQLIRTLIKWEALKLELVGVAHDGIEAMEKIAEFMPDIVITDIRMPGCDGIDLIQQTKSRYPNMDFIIISGYQHFDYAHNAIKYGVKDYLLKPLNEDEINRTLAGVVAKYEDEKKAANEMGQIVKRLSRDRETIRQAYSRHLFKEYNQTIAIHSLEDLKDKYAYKFDREIFRLLILKPDIKYYGENEALLKLLMEKSTAILEKNINKLIGDGVINMDVDRVYMLYNYDYSQKSTIRKALITCIDEVTSLRDIFKSINVTIALSEEVVAYDQLGDLKRQADRRLYDKILSSTNRLIESDQVGWSSNNHMNYWDEQFINSLVQKVRELDLAGYSTLLSQWAAKLSLAREINGEGYLQLSKNVIQLTTETMLRFQLIDEACIQKHILSPIEVDMARSVTQLLDTTVDYLKVFFDQAVVIRKERSRKPIEQILSYLADHYYEPVTLEEVSKMVGFNPSYFSTLFKKETGQNFLEYLTQIRVQYAQQALSDASKSIALIAEESGYADVKHFSKQFKKQTGLTPAKYRKLYY